MSHGRNPSRQPKGWLPFFSPGRIDDGVASLLLPRSDRLRDGCPSSLLAGSTRGWPPFFSPDRMTTIPSTKDWLQHHISRRGSLLQEARNGRLEQQRKS